MLEVHDIVTESWDDCRNFVSEIETNSPAKDLFLDAVRLRSRKKSLASIMVVNVAQAAIAHYGKVAVAGGNVCRADASTMRRILPESFVDRARRLDEAGSTDSALDLIYDSIDEMLLRGEFPKVDAVLQHLRIEDLSVDLLLGILTATLPARHRLCERAKAYFKIEENLHQRGELEEGLLTGLES